ncbi:hypothetical protein [Brevibacillus reuszeri]|uniref:hypothetical protein n=1 Tax=Brevibacillus reuszeri TaxID=54915 RepID=UPI000CCC3B79|nr:hypothetical protein [Brevibacillus reuszeri]
MSSTQNQILQDIPESARFHLSMVQGIIQRMSANCASCKTWCITIVSALLVLIADKGKPQFVAVAVIPVVLFLILDAYYLSLEKAFRNAHNSFIKKLHDGNIAVSDLFAIKPEGNTLKTVCDALISPATWPFYLTLLVMIGLTRFFIG